eukprot:607730_1
MQLSPFKLHCCKSQAPQQLAVDAEMMSYFVDGRCDTRRPRRRADLNASSSSAAPQCEAARTGAKNVCVGAGDWWNVHQKTLKGNNRKTLKENNRKILKENNRKMLKENNRKTLKENIRKTLKENSRKTLK